jgi:hypothetical protein
MRPFFLAACPVASPTRSSAESIRSGAGAGTAESAERSRRIPLVRSRIVRAAKLSSSVITRIAYDENESTLSIWFRETGRYVYAQVPHAIFDGLRDAPSAGRYFNECIKRRYPCRPDPERRKFRPRFND